MSSVLYTPLMVVAVVIRWPVLHVFSGVVYVVCFMQAMLCI